MENPATGLDSPNPGNQINRIHKSIEVGQSNGPDDLKFVSDLSTLLVATIQEAKDRISEVEYIFCSQLHPTFHKCSKSFGELYEMARKVAEEEAKEMHLKMINQIEELHLGKNKVAAENSNLLRKISLLEEKLSFKDVEITKQKELNDKFHQTIDTKSSDIISKQRLLRQYEERLSSLFTNTRELEEERCQLKEELKQKNEDVNNRKELQETILKHASTQAEKVLRMEELLQFKENECKNLEMKLENVEASLNELRIKFGMKTIELENCKELQEKLVQQNDVLTKKDQLLSVHEKEKASLLSRMKDLENSNEELPEKSDYQKHLVQKIESKDSELLAEKQKRRDLLTAYKSLKSQYNFLCARSGLTAENTPVKPKVEVETEPHNPDACKSLLVAGETTEVKKISSSGNLEKEKIARSNQSAYAGKEAVKVKKEMESGSDWSEERDRVWNQASVSAAASKWKTSRNSSSSTGRTSDWRGTRSRLGPNEPDPHDDFLDTPLENIRGKLGKAVVREEGHKIPGPVSRDTECGYSDEETEEVGINVDDEVQQQQQQQQSLKRSPNGFKYVEPVRKKAQREALKGIECKQCKKFYDAVLPNVEDKDTGDGKKGFRCEHLDGVSRHRYRFAPPMTPEGFWNIGFDSET